MLAALEKVFTSRKSRLSRAITNNDVEKMEQVLDEGIEINYNIEVGGFSEPPVHAAVRLSSNDCLRVLIRRGARLNIVNTAREWPLRSWFSYAHQSIKLLDTISEDRLETARILLESGAEFGTGGRHHVMAGTTPYSIVEQNPPLQELEKRLRAEVQARALARASDPVSHQSPRTRL